MAMSNDSSDKATTEESQSTSNNEKDSKMNSESNIVEVAQKTENLSTLVAAVEKADLVETLSGEGPFTVFAPTDEAFNALLAKLDITAEELLAREDLASILTYHVVAGKVMAADLSDGQVVKTVQGGELTVSVTDSGVFLTDAKGGKSNVTATDVEASNGVVHLIDAVLLP
ncbi:fasciclin domain-containing protein [Candidatus Saccharibacteria bacterium]|nr:fasciclin domain-containing protein [Candidatus Saccharibacteria bacterium]